VTIPVENATLRGFLTVPEHARGVILFAHGSGSSRFSTRNARVARVLQAAGFGTLLLDLLTPVEDEQDARTGRLRFDIKLLAHRVQETTQWLASEQGAPGLPIGFFGASTGAAAALLASLDAGVFAIVSRGGRPDLAHDALARVRVPTRLIVGGADVPVIPLNAEACDMLSCEKELVIIPGATHLFEEPGALDEVARLAADWFTRYVPPAA
jgi:dienelactone hydrolase